MPTRSAIAILFLTLAACGSGTEPTKTDSAKPAAAVAERIKPGLWAQTDLNGNPPPGVPPRCVSAQEAQSANGSDAEIRAGLAEQAKKDGCKLEAVTIDGPTITVNQVCSGAKLTQTSVYNGTSSSTKITGGGLPPLSTQSRRVGDC